MEEEYIVIELSTQLWISKGRDETTKTSISVADVYSLFLYGKYHFFTYESIFIE